MESKMQSYKGVSVSLAIFVLLAAVSWFGIDAVESAEEGVSSKSSIPVRVMSLSEEKPQVYRSFTGTTRASQRVTIRSQVGGRLLERAVNLGDNVAKGAILARLYNPEASPLALAAKQSWQQAKVQRAQQQRDFDRIRKLFESGAATKQEFETAQTGLWAAEATQAAAKSQYQRASQVDEEQIIRAPFAGVVTQTSVEEGEVISVGQPILQLADPNQVEIEVAISEQIAAALVKGDQVAVTLPLLITPVNTQGKVQEITPFRERGALPTLVVALPSSVATPGITAQVHVAIPDNSQFALPITAVIKTGGRGAAVYRVNGSNHVELVAVRPHQFMAGQVLVSAPLRKNDRVVIAGVQQLFEGAAVEIIDSSNNPFDLVGNELEVIQ
ncbi:MAG: efflux RND transporter periplasmic adaptor subunit [Pseudomonadales bacterium]|nr:efflux RND transporter periplasmic adaptor subunit [Pseudomonadales bacterium]